MVKAYFDETSDERSERVFAIGGYFGFEQEWENFESLWAGILERFRINAFHMVDCAHFRGEFLEWNESKRREFLGELIKAINGVNIYGFHSAVSLQDMKEVFPREHPDAPYFLCFQACVFSVAEMTEGLKEDIAFIFDRREDVRYRANRLYSHLQKLDWEGSERLGALAFVSDKKFLPLQAADFLAYEGCKYLDEELRATGRPIRKTLDLLRSRNRLFGRLWNRQALEKLKVDVAEAKAKGLIHYVPVKKGEVRR